MQDYIKLNVKVLRTPDNKPTCRTTNDVCVFYKNTNWGQSERCIYTTKEIERSENHMGIKHMGYTQPTAGCPLHETNGATDEP